MNAKSETLSNDWKKRVFCLNALCMTTYFCYSVAQLSRSSPEYLRIEARISETLPNIQLYEVERIQNKFLWRKYMKVTCSKAVNDR